MVKNGIIKQLALVVMMLIAGFNTAFAQKDVELIATGDGTTKQQATLSALRSGIEQSFGAFVSSDTRILNDNIVKDEIISVSSGNVKEYKVVSEGMIGNKWVVSVSMIVSLDKLMKYTMSKGATVELSGANNVVINTRLKKMNQRNAVKAMYSLEEQIIDLLPLSFDYSIELKEPASRNNLTTYVWPTIISVNVNSNINVIHEKLSKINELNNQYFGWLNMNTLLWSIREKAISFIMGGMTIKDDFGTYTFKETKNEKPVFRETMQLNDKTIKVETDGFRYWTRSQEGDFLRHQFDYVGGEDNALHWAGSKYARLPVFKYNYFHYVDPIEAYFESAVPVHYHFWYNHDNRFFIPKDENLINALVYVGKTDHGYCLPQFSTKIITLTEPTENTCILSFPLTMYYNENEMMRAKSISIYFEMSDEKRNEIKGELIMKPFLKW